ncbi:hypothetical protein KIN20_028131 [Parelaphostrongylus tenuis]|uniref:Uncharacterized protein n=1 Tax=Parelaphostrongylus tenuis TaxID=148309 RepID=A0AAD5R0J9_PARTN|nr:hypothetical protein KIN20_028131 [Parelaphostrongylus tenuis]
MAAIVVNSLLTGYFYLVGANYCHCPMLMYITGAIVLVITTLKVVMMMMTVMTVIAISHDTGVWTIEIVSDSDDGDNVSGNDNNDNDLSDRDSSDSDSGNSDNGNSDN